MVSLRRTLNPGALSTLASLTCGVWTVVDGVADAGHRGDQPGFAEPLAQRRDRDAHGVGERVGVLVPRPFQEFLGADNTALGRDEDFEHRELLPRQRDVAAVAVDLAAERIQAQAGDL